MPTGVERALADSLSLEHPDVPWTLPEVLPSTSDLRAALATLEAMAAPATPKHVGWCLAKLMMAFEPTTKLSPDETRLRAAVWLEACGDLGDALWSRATLLAIQSSKWMPKPAEFRLLVDQQFADRAKRLKRCRAMLAGHRVEPEKPAGPWQSPETREERLRASIASYRRFGRNADADRVQRQLDREAGAAPQQMLANGPAEAVPSPSLPRTSPEAQARMLLLAAKFHRKDGQPEIATAMEAKARGLSPPPPVENDGNYSEAIPEAAHG